MSLASVLKLPLMILFALFFLIPEDTVPRLLTVLESTEANDDETVDEEVDVGGVVVKNDCLTLDFG